MIRVKNTLIDSGIMFGTNNPDAQVVYLYYLVGIYILILMMPLDLLFK